MYEMQIKGKATAGKKWASHMIRKPCELTKDLFGWHRRSQARKAMCKVESILSWELFGSRKAT